MSGACPGSFCANSFIIRKAPSMRRILWPSNFKSFFAIDLLLSTMKIIWHVGPRKVKPTAAILRSRFRGRERTLNSGSAFNEKVVQTRKVSRARSGHQTLTSSLEMFVCLAKQQSNICRWKMTMHDKSNLLTKATNCNSNIHEDLAAVEHNTALLPGNWCKTLEAWICHFFIGDFSSSSLSSCHQSFPKPGVRPGRCINARTWSPLPSCILIQGDSSQHKWFKKKTCEHIAKLAHLLES